MEVHRQFVHTTGNGKRFVILHGDDFDSATRYRKLIGIIGDAAYDFAVFKSWHNRVRRFWWALLVFSSVVKIVYTRPNKRLQHLKMRLFTRPSAGAMMALSVVIFTNKLRVSDGIIYCNDGDWMKL